MSKEELPREKAVKYGIHTLSNRELLALLLKSGTPQKSVFDLADELLFIAQGLSGLYELEYLQLIHIKGIHMVKALDILGAIELGKRLSLSEAKQLQTMNEPIIIAHYFNQKIGFKKQEHFEVLLLDQKNKMIHEQTLFIGTLFSSIVHNREIFKLALQYSAAHIIIVHNHPSGDCIPSEQDILVTQNIEQAGYIMSIALLDHIIVGKNNYFSFKEHQLIG